jgi:hypothetical protein
LAFKDAKHTGSTAEGITDQKIAAINVPPLRNKHHGITPTSRSRVNTCGRSASTPTGRAESRRRLPRNHYPHEGRSPRRPALSDAEIQPGVASGDDKATVCEPGYAKRHLHTSGSLKAAVHCEYGLTSAKIWHCEIDHRIPLEVGGADVKANLWPQSYDTEPWNAAMKDRLENYIREQVRNAHTMTLEQGRRVFKGDWIEAYKKYLGQPR